MVMEKSWKSHGKVMDKYFVKSVGTLIVLFEKILPLGYTFPIIKLIVSTRISHDTISSCVKLYQNERV